MKAAFLFGSFVSNCIFLPRTSGGHYLSVIL